MKKTWVWGVVSAFLVVALAAFTIEGCDDDTDDEGRPSAFGDFDVHLDLLEVAHLADVDHRGLYIDFGSPAQAKYTVGNWRTGWGSEVQQGGGSFAYVGQRGRIYFNVDQAGPLTVQLRLQGLATHALTPYFNNEQLSSVTLPTESAFTEVSFQVPAEHVRAGENYLLLTFGGTMDIEGEAVSVALDSMRVIPGVEVPAGDFVPPTFASLVGAVTVDDKERNAVVVNRPTTLSWYVEVPADGHLGFGVGTLDTETAQATVHLTAEGGTPTQVFSENVGPEWTDKIIDLTRHAGKVVRIDFATNEGSGRIAWSTPSILSAPQEATEIPEARNVVVICEDTLRADKLRPFNPRTRVRTPALDAIAEDAVVFRNARSVENWTKPSVASFLTGLYPSTHQANTQTAVLSDRATLISEHLQANGFKTASFVANGYVSDRFGFDQGWDRYRNLIREGGDTDASNVYSEALEWLEANKDDRFFLYIQTIDPHVPYDPGERYMGEYDPRTDYTGQVQPRATPDLLEGAKRNPARVTFTESDEVRLSALHDGEITQHDEHMGAFVERLKELDLWENTLFVFVSDHGEEFGEHGSWGHGHSIYEELLHVPLLFRMEGLQGQNIHGAVTTMDLAPTVVQLAGVPALPGAEAVSLVPEMTGRASGRPAITFSEWQDERRVAASSRWKLIVRGNLTASLFDLARDPGEETQLDMTDRPVAGRYMRILQGQFLGSTDRSNWLSAEQGAGAQLESTEVEMDEALRGQLEALGYAH